MNLTTSSIKSKLIISLDNPSWYNNDKWRFSDLGVDGYRADNQITFSFKSIKQEWLKLFLKRFILRFFINKSCHTIWQLVSTINCFSCFLDSLPAKKQIHSMNDIDRNIIIKYLTFIGSKELSQTTRQIRLIALSNFFEHCRDLKLIDAQNKLIYAEDIPRRPNKIPRFIPESVISQLNDKLKYLDPHVKRMVLLLKETGMRINELIKLAFNCIFQDKDGDYFLKYFQSKMNKDHVIPISSELTITIQEQQQAVTKEPNQYKLLFPMPLYIQHEDSNIVKKKTRNTGRQWSRRCLARYIDKFSEKHRILGPDGNQWKFQFHSFRHTIATQMINNEVPQHIVQRFLGHESPTMTAQYAHIFDETLKKAFSEFQGKMVNISGDLISPEEIVNDLAVGSNADDIDVRWIKKHILAQALPNGTCTLPVISKNCPHANACLTCVNFRTDHRYLKTHKIQLEKTKTIIDQATQHGWQRQVEMNIAIQNNLEKIISSLEQKSDDTQT